MKVSGLEFHETVMKRTTYKILGRRRGRRDGEEATGQRTLVERIEKAAGLEKKGDDSNRNLC